MVGMFLSASPALSPSPILVQVTTVHLIAWIRYNLGSLWSIRPVHSVHILNSINYAWWSNTIYLGSNPGLIVYNYQTGYIVTALICPEEITMIFTLKTILRIKWVNLSKVLREGRLNTMCMYVAGLWFIFSNHGPGLHHLSPGLFKAPFNWSPASSFLPSDQVTQCARVISLNKPRLILTLTFL